MADGVRALASTGSCLATGAQKKAAFVATAASSVVATAASTVAEKKATVVARTASSVAKSVAARGDSLTQMLRHGD